MTFVDALTNAKKARLLYVIGEITREQCRQAIAYAAQQYIVARGGPLVPSKDIIYTLDGGSI